MLQVHFRCVEIFKPGLYCSSIPVLHISSIFLYICYTVAGNAVLDVVEKVLSSLVVVDAVPPADWSSILLTLYHKGTCIGLNNQGRQQICASVFFTRCLEFMLCGIFIML